MEAMRRHGRGLRVARGAAAASVATFVALLSHVSGGGQIPGILGIVVPLALSFVACTVLAGRRTSAPRLALAVAVSQVLFHTLFVLGDYRAGAAGHVHGAAPTATAASAATEAMPHVMTTDAGMWAWHAVAALVTTVALHRGERTLAALRELAQRSIAWVRARARIIATNFGPSPVRRVSAEVVAVVRPVSALLVVSARRRGPPARTA